jgi:hypothetical protein
MGSGARFEVVFSIAGALPGRICMDRRCSHLQHVALTRYQFVQHRIHEESDKQP